MRNINSSRFGKYVEVHFNEKVCFEKYLLELTYKVFFKYHEGVVSERQNFPLPCPYCNSPGRRKPKEGNEAEAFSLIEYDLLPSN